MLPARGGQTGRRRVVPSSLRRHAIDVAAEAARDPAIDQATKATLIQQVMDTASGPSVYGRLVYRLIAVALGLVAILVVVFSFVLLLTKHTVNAAFWTLGSAAIGALGGVFAPHGNGETATTPAGKVSTDVPAAPPGQGNAGPNPPPEG